MIKVRDKIKVLEITRISIIIIYDFHTFVLLLISI